MTVSAVGQRRSGGGYLERPAPSGLADVIDSILDKGLVIDAFVRVSLVGIELLTVDLRIVIASVDTYLRFAEAVNRLDLQQTSDAKGIPELFEKGGEEVAEHESKGAVEGGMDAIKEKMGLGRGSDDDDDEKSRSRSRSGSRSNDR